MDYIRKHRTLWLLVALTVLAFYVRIAGAKTNILYVVDTQVLRQGLDIGQSLSGHSNFDINLGPSRFKYPLTLAYYALSVYGVVFVGGALTGHFRSVQQFTDFLFLHRADMDFLATFAIAVIDVALVPAIYIAARFLNKRHSGWFAAGLVAFNLLLVQYSHQARPHTALATFSFVAVMLLVVLAYRGKWYWAVAATVISAFAVGTIQSGIALIPTYLLAWLVRTHDGQRFQWKQLFTPLVIGNMILFGILCLLFYPTLITGLRSNPAGGVSTALLAPDELGVLGIPDLLAFVRSLFIYQPLLTVLAPFATVYFVWRLRNKPRLLLVALPFPLINVVVWGIFAIGYPRRLALLVPFMAVVVAYLLEDCVYFIATRTKRSYALVLGAALLFILGPLAVAAIRLDYVMGQPDTRVTASQWVKDNVSTDASLLAYAPLPELRPSQVSLKRQAAEYPGSQGTYDQWLLTHTPPGPTFNIVNAKLDTRIPTETLVQKYQVQYALVITNSQRLSEQPPEIVYLLAHARPVFTACPGKNFQYSTLPEDFGDLAFTDVWKVEKPGPIVLIFQMDQPPHDTPPAMFCG